MWWFLDQQLLHILVQREQNKRHQDKRKAGLEKRNFSVYVVLTCRTEASSM